MTSPAPDEAGTIQLEVRLHLLQSNVLSELHVTLTDDEVGEIIQAVNEVWAQADIVWQVETIVREPARNPDVFRQVLRGSSSSLVADVLPRENIRSDIWNVFLVRDFGGRLGGVYLPNQAVVAAEVDPLGNRDLSGGTARILAHELGHSLGLGHVPCTEAGNLMAAGCPRGIRTRLEPVQIAIARRQAGTGRPF